MNYVKFSLFLDLGGLGHDFGSCDCLIACSGPNKFIAENEGANDYTNPDKI